jgi:hypothetical protein
MITVCELSSFLGRNMVVLRLKEASHTTQHMVMDLFTNKIELYCQAFAESIGIEPYSMMNVEGLPRH